MQHEWTAKEFEKLEEFLMTKRLWDNYVPNYDYNAVKKGIKRLNLDYYMRTLNFEGSFVFYHSMKGGTGPRREQTDFILYP